MYPIDLLKVPNPFRWSHSLPDNFAADTDASCQPFTHGRLHRHIECYGHNIKSRRFPHIVERSIQRGAGSWWVFGFQAPQDLGLTG